jgi:hypothetical protein
MCTIDEMRLSAMLLPVWVVFLFIAFKLSRCALSRDVRATTHAAASPVALRLPGYNFHLYRDPSQICFDPQDLYFVIDYFSFEHFVIDYFLGEASWCQLKVVKRR